MYRMKNYDRCNIDKRFEKNIREYTVEKIERGLKLIQGVRKIDLMKCG